MNNLGLLLTDNLDLPFTKIEITGGRFVYRQKDRDIDASSIKNIIRFIKTLLIRYSNVKLPIVFELGAAIFADKLTYVIFECICYYLIIEKNYKVKVVMNAKKHIHTAGIESSPLMLLTNGDDDHIERFKKAFRFEIYHNHYRRVITKDNFDKADFLCQVMDEVASFQKFFDVNFDCREDIAEVIIELIGNASEHGGSNCLIDFDIAPSYSKIGSDKVYLGINIAIVNLSKQLLGTALKNKICEEKINEPRYVAVKEAYNNHTYFFNRDYLEEDFFNLTAFQHKISGRHANIVTGGTGLTKLIESLETRSEAHMCYVTSGKRTIWFISDYLKYNDNGWLGFNETNDFINDKPDTSILAHNNYTFPGTAYNLNFVLQRED